MKNISTKLKTLALVGMVMGFAFSAEAAAPIEYRVPVYKMIGGVTSPTNGIDRWELRSTNIYSVVTTETAEMTAGWWAVTGTVNRTGIVVRGEVHLILMDECSLTVQNSGCEDGGITISGANNSLTIYGQSVGTGRLTTHAVSRSTAGIGGKLGDNANGSNITINGGMIEAVGSEINGAAGIGGGAGSGSNIIINGGTVTASGGGAGIGGSSSCDGCAITINGGVVKATGGGDGAGIGGGSRANGTDITINGGVITANGGEYAAGIGGGNGSDPGKGMGKNITINGGKVVATGGKMAAGIGGGYQGASCDIAINGGTVIATGGDSNQSASPGIGSGVSVYTSCRIYAANNVLVKADTSTPPKEEVVHASPTDDIADLLKEKRYVTAEPKVFLVTVTPTVVPGASKVRVYTNDTVEVFTPYVVCSNDMVKVVYTADSGCVFAEGKTEYVVEQMADKATTIVAIPTEDQPVLKSVDEEIEKPASDDSIVYNGMEWVGITNIDERLILKDGVTKATNVIFTNAIFALPAKIVSTPTVAGTNYFWKGEPNPVSKTNDVTIAWSIVARPITITSGSAMKIWDGTALTNWTATVTAGSFVGEENFAYTFTGSQTAVGWSTNFYTYAGNANTETYNYAVTQEYGILTVTQHLPVTIVTNGLDVADMTYSLLTNGTKLVANELGEIEVLSNAQVVVHYEIQKKGVYFSDGSTTYETMFAAEKSVNMASAVIVLPAVPAEPSLLLGAVAQRYPWNGKVDVQYWAKNTPNEGYQITVTVILPDGTTASETQDCKNGKNTVAFDARAAFGEVQVKGAKVMVTLEVK